jgi:hypothetical protein
LGGLHSDDDDDDDGGVHIVLDQQTWVVYKQNINKYSQTCIKRSTFGTKKRWSSKTVDLLFKIRSIHMKFSMMAQEKGDL